MQARAGSPFCGVLDALGPPCLTANVRRSPRMAPIDPTPFVAIYAALVFLVPWLVLGSFIVRGLLHARNCGIPLLSWTASAQIRALRQTDARAAFLHQRSLRWLRITSVIWFAGFAVMCLTLYLLHRRGIV